MKKTLLLFMGVLSSMLLFSQSQLHVFQDWETTAGTQNFYYRNITKTDGSGNVYVAGATLNASNNTTDILVAKYNASGVQQWINQYNGAANYYDFATALVVDGSGNVYITGTVTNDTVNHYSDIITIKYNSSGVQQWLSTYDGAAGYFDSGTDLFVNASGGVGLVGSSMNASTNMDFVTIFYNSSGVQQWATVYDHSSHMNDVPVNIVKKGPSIYVSGVVQTSATAYSWNVVEYNSSGVQQSVATSSGGSSNIDTLNDMVTDAAGNIYIAGATSTATHGYDYDIIKLDSTLVIQWEKTYDGADHLDDVSRSLKVDALGNVYVTGSSKTSSEGYNYLTQKYDSGGNLIWNKSYNDSLNGDDDGYGLELSSSGQIYVTGSAYTDSLNTVNYHTIKYDTAGTVLWSVDFDGDRHLKDIATNIAIDTVGNVIVAGSSETAAGMFEYATVRYVERMITNPKDFSGEQVQSSLEYFTNKGQLISTSSTLIPDVHFYTKGSSPAFYFKDDTMSMVFYHVDTIASTNDTLHRVDLSFTSCNEQLKIYPLDQQPDYLNYFLAHCPDGVTEIHGNQRLVTTNLYDNIDLVYSSNQKGLKYYFVVKPGGNPDDIRMQYTGASSTGISSNVLNINSGIGSLHLARPFTYLLNTSNDTITGSGVYADWHSNMGDNYSFDTHGYDSTKTLIIEVEEGRASLASHPTNINNMNWSTYYGGYSDNQMDINIDTHNQLYTAGNSSSLYFPATLGSFQTNLFLEDATVSKFTPNGQLIWATFYGGNSLELARSIDVATNGNIYFTGYTYSSDLPVPRIGGGAYVDTSYDGSQDIFIACLDPSGQNLKWSTYYGSNGYDDGMDLVLDNTDYLYVVGRGDSLNSLMPNLLGGSYNSNNGTGLLLKFNTAFQRTWATNIGTHTYNCIVTSVDVDENHDLYICGDALSNGIPVVSPGAGDSLKGLEDGFIMKFRASNNAIEWSTYYGGDGNELLFGISASKNNPNVYVVGSSTSTSHFPFKHENATDYVDSTFNGGAEDITIAKLNKNTGANLWSTFYGGTGNERAYNVEVAANGNLFITGETHSTSLYWPSTIPGIYLDTVTNNSSSFNDACILGVSINNALIWSTFYGGTEVDAGFSLKTNSLGELFVLGGTSSTSGFPFATGYGIPYFQDTLGVSSVNGSGFISRFETDSVHVGITEYQKQNGAIILTYPNPTSDELNVSINSSHKEQANMYIYNINGQKVFSEKITVNTGVQVYRINTQNLTDGMYILQIASEKESNYYSKFVKQ